MKSHVRIRLPNTSSQPQMISTKHAWRLNERNRSTSSCDAKRTIPAPCGADCARNRATVMPSSVGHSEHKLRLAVYFVLRFQLRDRDTRAPATERRRVCVLLNASIDRRSCGVRFARHRVLYVVILRSIVYTNSRLGTSATTYPDPNQSRRCHLGHEATASIAATTSEYADRPTSEIGIVPVSSAMQHGAPAT
jgi:hypothetical protein